MKHTKDYWISWARAAGIRAIKTVAQSAAASIGATALLTEVDWMVVGSTALLAGVVSLLTSIAGLPELSTETPTETSPEE